MAAKKIYAAITKVDAEQRMVYGYASTEALDSDGERVMKSAMEEALPEYAKFSNIREMHKNSAVGVAKDITVDDKGVYIAAKVVDDAAWEKVREGVYKGFSIGGRTLAKDGNVITKIKLSEISLVDRPANPEAVFDVWKAADTQPSAEEQLIDEFSELIKSGAATLPEVIAALKDGTLGKRQFSDKERKDAADKGEAMPDGSFPIKTAKDLENAIRSYGRSSDKAAAKAHIIQRAKALKLTDELPADWEGSTKKDEPKKMAKTVTCADGVARSFTLANVDAAQLVTVGATLAKCADAKAFAELVELAGGTVVEDEPMAKGMYTVSTLAEIIGELAAVASSAAAEAQSEGDDSPIPDRLKSALKVLGSILEDMAGEEVDELVSGDGDSAMSPATMAMAARIRDLRKAGKRHSKEDMEHLRGIHKKAKAIMGHANAMGLEPEDDADDGAANDGADNGDKKPAASGKKPAAADAQDDDDDTDKGARSSTLNKVALGKAATALTRIEAITAEMEQLRKRLKQVEDQPAAGPAPRRSIVIDKAQDSILNKGAEPAPVAPVVDNFGKVDEAATGIKKIHLAGPSRYTP